MKTHIVVYSNDTRSCYDRIIHVAAFLALRHMGIPTYIISSMLHIIHMVKHSICTSFGDSTDIYGGKDRRIPPHSTIQGNAVSPMIWAAISKVLFLAIKKIHYGGGFRASITNLRTSLAGFVFCR